jgi:ABC-type branched-subunit amino acid transport system ATPase component
MDCASQIPATIVGGIAASILGRPCLTRDIDALGSIRFAGADRVAVPPPRRAHSGVAHVPEGRQVFPSLTVLENLEMGAYTNAGRAAWRDNLERTPIARTCSRTAPSRSRAITKR